ncbi:MAG TPA: hypothetical protein VNX70_17035 [Bryobacteraceae bacterium]|nr:hypothetical protein [Bryobacteraceae bacterium]
MSEPAVAFLSKGKLHVRRNGVTRVVDSEFERTVRERTASIERRHAWKTQGRGAMFMGGVWSAQANARSAVPVSLTGLAAGQDGTLLYSMETDSVSGIFLLDAASVETRLFHTADFCIRHAALNPEGFLAATAFHKDDMRSNIVVLPLHGTDLSEVTEGDSFDQFPQWVAGAKRRIVFQSAGVGRDAAGRFAGLGPCSIQELDLDSGDLEEVASESGRDLLQPRKTEDGTLYYIRKPYQSGVPEASLLGSLKDVVLFPFRMAQAVFQYFNVFSMMYTGKPLVTSKGAVQRKIDPRQLFIHGNLARAQMAQASEDEAQQVVPSSWELVRHVRNGDAEVIARNVLTFDLASDGSALYSDGAAISRIGQDGSSERMLQAELIEKVLAL